MSGKEKKRRRWGEAGLYIERCEYSTPFRGQETMLKRKMLEVKDDVATNFSQVTSMLQQCRDQQPDLPRRCSSPGALRTDVAQHGHHEKSGQLTRVHHARLLGAAFAALAAVPTTSIVCTAPETHAALLDRA